MLIDIYTVQKKDIATQIRNGFYTPKLSMGFAKYHPYFYSAYSDMLKVYSNLCGVPMLEDESGLWGYLTLDVIDQNEIKDDEVICKLTVNGRFLLVSDFNVWESILDGNGSVMSRYNELFLSFGALQQVFFSSAVVENVEFVKTPVFS